MQSLLGSGYSFGKGLSKYARRLGWDIPSSHGSYELLGSDTTMGIYLAREMGFREQEIQGRFWVCLFSEGLLSLENVHFYYRYRE